MGGSRVTSLDDARHRRRMRRLMRQFDRMDAGKPVRRGRTTRPGRAGRVLTRLLTRLLVVVLTLTLLAIGLVLKPSMLPSGVRSSLGISPNGHLLGSGKGGYKFLMMEPGTHDVPVTYDSCQTLHYVINPSGAAPGFQDGAFIRQAVDEISQASGLKFHYDGTTTDRVRDRDFAQGPILISFDDLPAEANRQDAVAVGGSSTLTRGGHIFYATGEVTFKRDFFASLPTRFDGQTRAREIALHELGHVLGLAHVKDKNEVMYPSAGHTDDLGPGDRLGLKILGSGPCV